MEANLTKMDVARRQLTTAIRLLFDGGDLVSICSLASNAWEVIDVLCNKGDVQSLSNETREHIKGEADLKFDYINSPYRNFFKHADRDPDAILTQLEEANVDAVIFLAVEDYLRLIAKSPIEFQVLQLWYLAANAEKVSADSLHEILPTIDSAFSGIQELPRNKQILLGRKVLDEARKDERLLRDSRTEAAF